MSEEMHTLARADDDYPRWLRSISDRPAVLYLRGRLLPGAFAESSGRLIADSVSRWPVDGGYM